MLAAQSPYIADSEIALLIQPQPRYQLQAVESIDRLRELWELDKEAYGDCSLEFTPFLDWWTRYELGSRILLQDDRIVAAIGIYPVTPEQYKAFTEGWIKESALQPVPFGHCEDQPVSHWYASGIVVRPECRGWHSPLRTLLTNGLRCWLDSGHLKYPLNLISIAEYSEGARLLELFGFKKLRDKAQMPDNCDLYGVRFGDRASAMSLLRQRIG